MHICGSFYVHFSCILMGMQHHANTILEDIPIQIYIVYIWCVCTVIVRKCSHRSVCHIVRMLNRRRHPSNLRLGF